MGGGEGVNEERVLGVGVLLEGDVRSDGVGQ